MGRGRSPRPAEVDSVVGCGAGSLFDAGNDRDGHHRHERIGIVRRSGRGADAGACCWGCCEGCRRSSERNRRRSSSAGRRATCITRPWGLSAWAATASGSPRCCGRFARGSSRRICSLTSGPRASMHCGRQTSLTRLLAESDIVILCVPLNSQTRGDDCRAAACPDEARGDSDQRGPGADRRGARPRGGAAVWPDRRGRART